ncbi:MAG: VOC family protein [Hydrogenophaga sp.]|uniref:VOC family protein n=1 Tax=Hydrogenophaga sp. TaxID=1904254 RepID=UPI0025C4E293|nr:VOC family protein [Hydrogenophaga sp.]MBT9553746.1 VOC family protein [Hydrogenophaga sp.]
MTTHAQIDHLVVAARTLDEGVALCEATLGVVPGPGGEHALFGTHNRLLRLHSEQAPRAYLEIIAVNPLATPTRPAPLKRWFDLDDPTLRARLAQQGPQLVHWVASVPDIDAATARLRALGIERGPVIAASRPTPSGLLRWRISVRDDGQRLFDGALPTLIQWGDTHPAETMPVSGLALRGLTLHHPEAPRLRQALDAIGLDAMAVAEAPAALTALLDTPLGPRTLT